jgi:DNA-nicking Smr family endonuclease
VSKKHRDLTAEEAKLWRRVTAGLKTRGTQRSAGVKLQTDTAADVRVPKPSSAAPSAPPKARAATPQNRGNEKRVRRGTLRVGATLDLHGHTQDSARAALARFLRAAQRRGDRTVVVVTGVGRAGEGVLKKRLPAWLSERDIANLVSGYAPAHRSHGGAGAFYVFIRRRIETPA